MTLQDQINQTIDRLQDVMLIAYPVQGPEQRKEVQLVLLDLLTTVSKMVFLPADLGQGNEASIDAGFKEGFTPRDRHSLSQKNIRFLLLPDDFTVSP